VVTTVSMRRIFLWRNDLEVRGISTSCDSPPRQLGSQAPAAREAMATEITPPAREARRCRPDRHARIFQVHSYFFPPPIAQNDSVHTRIALSSDERTSPGLPPESMAALGLGPAADVALRPLGRLHHGAGPAALLAGGEWRQLHKELTHRRPALPRTAASGHSITLSGNA
jgi:hypothetical protein